MAVCRCVAETLEHVAGENAEVMVATHNQGSIEATVALMGRLALDPSKGVYFGQLLGMADHLTFTLGRNGYNVSSIYPEMIFKFEMIIFSSKQNFINTYCCSPNTIHLCAELPFSQADLLTFTPRASCAIVRALRTGLLIV